MDKKFHGIRIFCTFILTVAGIASLAAESENILKNPEFAKQGKSWQLRYNKLQDSISEEDGKKVVRMEIAPAVQGGGNVFSQILLQPQGGNYIYSVELAPSRKFKDVLVILFWKENGKNVYRSSRLSARNYPKPGQWGKIVGEVKIPDGKRSVTFAVEIRDPDAGGHILIRNPEMKLRDEL